MPSLEKIRTSVSFVTQDVAKYRYISNQRCFSYQTKSEGVLFNKSGTKTSERAASNDTEIRKEDGGLKKCTPMLLPRFATSSRAIRGI